jgi:SSS family solute:Na+ symporter
MLSTSISVDLYKSFYNPAASDRQLLRVSRQASIGAGLLGVIVAIKVPSIISVLTIFYSLVSVALFVPVVVGLYWRRPDARAALWAIAISVPCTLALQIWIGGRILRFLNPVVIGIAISLAVLLLLTLKSGDVRK